MTHATFKICPLYKNTHISIRVIINNWPPPNVVSVSDLRARSQTIIHILEKIKTKHMGDYLCDEIQPIKLQKLNERFSDENKSTFDIFKNNVAKIGKYLFKKFNFVNNDCIYFH